MALYHGHLSLSLSSRPFCVSRERQAQPSDHFLYPCPRFGPFAGANQLTGGLYSALHTLRLIPPCLSSGIPLSVRNLLAYSLPLLHYCLLYLLCLYFSYFTLLSILLNIILYIHAISFLYHTLYHFLYQSSISLCISLYFSTALPMNISLTVSLYITHCITLFITHCITL